MKANVNVLFLLLCAGTLTLSAQETTAQASSGRLKFLKSNPSDSLLPPGRNELFFDVAPYVSFLLGGRVDGPTIRGMYKRVNASGTGAVRLGIGLQPAFYSNSNNVETTVYPFNDTIRYSNNYWKFTSPSVVARVGYEWRGKQRNRFQFWSGIDVIGGTFSRNFQLVDVQEVRTSTGEWKPDLSPGTQTFVYHQQHKEQFYSAGLAMHAGVRYTINRRFLVTAQTGFISQVVMGKEYSRISRTELVSNDVAVIDFNTPAIINELAIVYRF